MVRSLLDTNIIIDHLNGVAEAQEEIRRHDGPAISIITWMEVLVGAGDLEAETREALEAFERFELDNDIAERAVRLRRQGRIRLPDAIILATAQAHGRILVTRNTRDFPADSPGVRIPYRL